MTTAVLITGTSSGIGRSAALRLARRPEFTVYATARRPESIADLAEAGARTMALDVTDDKSMISAVEAVEREHGSVGVLINNAGYGEYGTIEEADLEAVRRQFETNVFGLSRMTQLVLPAMRTARRGRIINIGSMAGRVTFPAGGYYHASKHAVEAISDALRFEVAPFGLKVSLIEPGPIRTGFLATASHSLSSSATPAGPYAKLTTAVDQGMAQFYASKVIAGPAESVAKAVERAATASRPRTRYVITSSARSLVHTRRLFGGRVFDMVLGVMFRGAA